MARCKGCVFFDTQESQTVCLAQDTYSAEMNDPDLGEKLRGCKYEKKEEEACQKPASSTNGSGRKKASRAKSAENI